MADPYEGDSAAPNVRRLTGNNSAAGDRAWWETALRPRALHKPPVPACLIRRLPPMGFLATREPRRVVGQSSSGDGVIGLSKRVWGLWTQHSANWSSGRSGSKRWGLLTTRKQIVAAESVCLAKALAAKPFFDNSTDGRGVVGHSRSQAGVRSVQR